MNPTAGTQIPARVINLRSDGIKDLRFGYLTDEEWEGQDPDKLGTTVTVSASGGAKTNSCSDGPAQRSVTSISMGGVALSEASIDWILDILSLRYPGAYIKDSYPLFPTLIPSGIGTTIAGATFHYNPLDPGIYNVTITAIQDDGQTTTTVLNVPAYLMDATITLPVQP